jgi:hypothetical protein
VTKQTINYVSGDATAPQGQGVKIIAHICNDIGAWGKGFVLSVSKRWNHPELMYRCWHSGDEQEKFKLGVVQFVQVEPDIWIANMIGQHGISGLKSANALAPIRYDAVESVLVVSHKRR